MGLADPIGIFLFSHKFDIYFAFREIARQIFLSFLARLFYILNQRRVPRTMVRKFTRSVVRHFIPSWQSVRDPVVRNRYGALEGGVSIVVNVILFVLKIVWGIISGSVALIADGIHTLSDVLTSIVIIVSFRIAKKPSDAIHPFGHGRMEAIASVIVAVLLMMAGVEIL